MNYSGIYKKKLEMKSEEKSRKKVTDKLGKVE